MQVKLGNKIYDSKDEPILIIFDKEEGQLISMMSDHQKDKRKFCSYPDTPEWTNNDSAKLRKWMSEDTEQTDTTQAYKKKV